MNAISLRKLCLLILLLPILAACGGDEAAPADTETGSSSGTPAESTSPAESAPPEESAPPAAGARTPDEAMSLVSDVDAQARLLEGFQSYRIRSVSRAVTTGNSETDTTTEYVEERINEPLTISVAVTSDPNAPGSATFITADTLYQVNGDSCETSVLNTETMQMSVEMLRGMSGQMGLALATIGTPELVAEGETVNGVVTDHYRALTEQTGIRVEGNFWLAREGYVVRATSSNTITSGDSTVETTVAYDLEAIDQIADLAPPASCAAAGDLPSNTLPKPDDAVVSLATDTLITFETGLSFDETVAFYEERLAAEGYTLQPAPTMEGFAIMNATRDDEKLTVTIAAGTTLATAVTLTTE